MYILAYSFENTTNRVSDLEDHFQLFSYRADAERMRDTLLARGDLYCWAITKVLDASEPHWEEEM